jgi:hypothetical protein
MEGKSFNVGRRAGSPLGCCQLREEHSRETSRHFLEVAVAKTGTMAMTRRPIRFTPDNLLRVRQMAAEGNSSIQIAQSMGSTSASVKNVCCRHNIKIPRRRRSVENTLSPLVAHLPASLSTEFHVGGGISSPNNLRQLDNHVDFLFDPGAVAAGTAKR